MAENITRQSVNIAVSSAIIFHTSRLNYTSESTKDNYYLK